jgi:hypothetical protein
VVEVRARPPRVHPRAHHGRDETLLDDVELSRDARVAAAVADAFVVTKKVYVQYRSVERR